jgi:hypothetical protein
MTSLRALAPIAAAAVAASWVMAAQAQFGYYQLPKNDFVWNWGSAERSGAKFEDFTVNGSEGGFNCELKGKLNGASQLTPSALHTLEDQLRSRIDFIYASSTTMNQLDNSHELDWARLSCAKPQAKQLTDQEKADKEAKAREKMQREIDRRRAHQQPTE